MKRNTLYPNLRHFPSQIASLLHRCSSQLLIVATGAVLLACLPVRGQTDNFDSGSLGPNWATSISANYPATITFPADAFGGKAIRLEATQPSQVDSVDEDNDTPRVMAWRTDRMYTNFYVAVDILSWNSSINRDTNSTLITLMARMTNVVRDPTVPFGRPDAMALILNVNRFGGTPQGTRGVLNLFHLVNGMAANLLECAGIQGDFTMNPGHQYRMVFTGTNFVDSTGAYTNGMYWGRVYDLQDLTRPLATVLCPDGFPNYGTYFGDPSWGAPGYSGIAGIGDGAARSADVTFDNFVAAEYPPATVSLPGTTNGQAGVPQVINRTPSSYSNFYAPAGGITFTATTLGGGNVTGVKLFLNGVDVSSGLILGAVSNSRSVSFPGSGLTANMVYDARIELENAAGQKTTNAWTFDTFTDAYLASSVCKNIECEEFNFGGGQFIDNPVPSGWPTNVTYYNDFYNVPQPWSGATNQDAGPPYTSYVNKGTSADQGIDYWDVEGGDHSKQQFESDFRPLFGPKNSPGTTEGCYAYDYYEAFGTYSGQNRRHIYDTQRQKYITVSTNIHEYMLERLEGGEWYNYTRIFNATNYYNVYLRHASEFNEQVRLDRILPGGTLSQLGEFYTTNALAKSNFRYAPLMAISAPANNLIVNGTFQANASGFTVSPGYIGGGGVNPTSITGWTDLYGTGAYGVNGGGTSVGYPFAPAAAAGVTYAFIQYGSSAGSGHVLKQALTGLTPNTTYTLMYSVGARSGNASSYRVSLFADNTYTTSYYDSGVQLAPALGFNTVTATFTTPASLGSAPNIQLANRSTDGEDLTVDFANVFLVAGSTPPAWSSKLAVVNLSGTNTLRLTVDVAQEERTKQGLNLNYMVFVPALLVESSAQAQSGYTLDNNAAIEPITRQITIPQNGNARYYRLRWPGNTVSIKNVSVAGGTVTLSYQ